MRRPTRRALTLATATVLTIAAIRSCASRDDTSAVPGAGATSSSAPSAPPSAACSHVGVLDFLDEVQRQAATGVVDPDDDALQWHTGLLQAGGTGEVAEAVAAVEAYLTTASGTTEARARGRAIAQAAVNLIEACDLEGVYDIAVPKKIKPQKLRPSSNAEPPAHPAVDPQFGSCTAANRAGYGPYRRGADTEYGWYEDRDGDGTVCER